MLGSAGGGLSPTGEPILIPPGRGFKVLGRAARLNLLASGDPLDVLTNKLLLWEKPRRRHRYVIGVDVSNGQGLDRSCIDVTRVGTLIEPPEQVGQFVSDDIDPADLAGVIDTLGRVFHDRDGIPAMVAIECNGFGLGTQAELIRHHGYTNLYVWQYEDAATASGRYTQKYGWWTSVRTRPLIIQRYIKAVRHVDEATNMPDYVINSPFTIAELADFQTPHAEWAAEAAPGAHDDCIMAGAISIHVAQTLYFEATEPLTEQRARLAEERQRRQEAAPVGADGKPIKVDYQNCDAAVDEMTGLQGDGFLDDALDSPLHIG
jgi:hypothetical protein